MNDIFWVISGGVIRALNAIYFFNLLIFEYFFSVVPTSLHHFLVGTLVAAHNRMFIYYYFFIRMPGFLGQEYKKGRN